MVAYQSAIAYEFAKVFVFALVDSLLEDAEGHWIFDNVVVVRDEAFVDAAMEKSGRVVATIAQSDLAIIFTDIYMRVCVMPLTLVRESHRLPW